MTAWTRADAGWFDLYATNARPATGHESQPCPVCTRKFRTGERIADLSGDRGTAHCACIAIAAARSGERH